jgi:hypothetical protein
MSALFESTGRRLVRDAELTDVPEGDQDAVRYLSFSKGLMDDFYARAFAATEEQLGDEAKAWADEVTSFRVGFVKMVAGVSGSAAGGSDLVKDQGQEVAMGVLEDWLRRTVQVKPSDAPHGLIEGVKSLQRAELNTAWQTTFASHAAAITSTDESMAGLVPVTLRFPGQESRTYSGDPYGRGRGQIRYVTGPDDDFVAVLRRFGDQDAVAKMTPRQLDSYSRWVQDPAVVRRLSARGAFDTLVGRGASG